MSHIHHEGGLCPHCPETEAKPLTPEETRAIRHILRTELGWPIPSDDDLGIAAAPASPGVCGAELVEHMPCYLEAGHEGDHHGRWERDWRPYPPMPWDDMEQSWSTEQCAEHREDFRRKARRPLAAAPTSTERKSE